MGHKDHEQPSAEDYKLFEELLVAYYGKPYAEADKLLRGKIMAFFRGKDTNPNYRSVLLRELDYLTSNVVFRLISFNGWSHRERGEGIRDVELMARRMAGFVYKEELGRIRRRLPEQTVDDGERKDNHPWLRQPVDDEYRSVESEILKKCYEDCLERLPARRKAIFRAYYPDVGLDPSELNAARMRLANEEAGVTPEQARQQTAQQAGRILNNLQSKLNKWRKRHVEQCVKKCVEAKQARHPALSFLKQQ